MVRLPRRRAFEMLPWLPTVAGVVILVGLLVFALVSLRPDREERALPPAMRPSSVWSIRATNGSCVAMGSWSERRGPGLIPPAFRGRGTAMWVLAGGGAQRTGSSTITGITREVFSG